MGYDTNYWGEFEVNPPLNEKEIEYLEKFSETRRVKRTKGPYYVENGGFKGQDREEDVIEYNSPPDGQPSLWCDWIPSEDGTKLIFNESEKFNNGTQWIKYIIEHFLKPDALAKKHLNFLTCNHFVNGKIIGRGEEPVDNFSIYINNNQVKERKATLVENDNFEPLSNEIIAKKLTDFELTIENKLNYISKNNIDENTVEIKYNLERILNKVCIEEKTKNIFKNMDKEVNVKFYLFYLNYNNEFTFDIDIEDNESSFLNIAIIQDIIKNNAFFKDIIINGEIYLHSNYHSIDSSYIIKIIDNDFYISPGKYH